MTPDTGTLSPATARRREQARDRSSGRFGAQPVPLQPPAPTAHGLSDADKTIALGRELVKHWFPFYAPVVDNITTIKSDKIPTAAIQPDLRMYVNPDYVTEMHAKDPDLVGAIMLHEVCHITLRHAKRKQNRNHDLWNIAGDMEIHTLFPGNKVPYIPDTMIAEDMGYPMNRTAEEYYQMLIKDLDDEQKQKPPPQSGGSGDDSDQQGSGSGSGGQQDRQDQDGNDGQQNADGNADVIRRRLEDMEKNGGCAGCDSDPADPDPDAAPGVERLPADQAETFLDPILREFDKQAEQAGSRHPGVLHGYTKRAIEEARKPVRIPWETLLAQAIDQQIWAALGHSSTDWKSPAGYNPWPHPLMKMSTRKPQLTAAVIADTSGSMMPDDMETVVSVIDDLLTQADNLADDEVRVLAVDTHVDDLESVRDISEIARKGGLGGGGGTDMMEGIRYLAEDRHEQHGVILVLTDGYTHVPEENPWPQAGNVVFMVIGGRDQVEPVCEQMPDWVNAIPVPNDE